MLNDGHSWSDTRNRTNYSLKTNSIMEMNYKVSLWSGCGYCTDDFVVPAYCEDHALDVVVAQLLKESRFDLLVTEEERQEMLDFFNQTEDDYGIFLYVDATMEGAPYPVYVRTENLGIERVS